MENEKIDLEDQNYYFNRELSWLRFNTRVLAQAKDKTLPLLERLKFLAIYGTNLDEFYMIRVAGLNDLFKAGVTGGSADKMTPYEQLVAIRDYIHAEKLEVQQQYVQITQSLKDEGVNTTDFEHLTRQQQADVESYFLEQIFPVIVPIAVDSTHPFPHLNNLSFALAIKLKDDFDLKYGLIRIPRVLPRFIETLDDTFVPIESVVQNFASTLFPGYETVSTAAFRVTRNADIAIKEEEADDFMEILEEGLRLRKKGDIVRLEIQKDADEDLTNFLNRHINVDDEDIYYASIPLNLGALWQLVGQKKFAHLTLPVFKPRTLPPLDKNENIFRVIERQDLLHYHPYESFDPVVEFIQKAAKDSNVLAIRMTLYRAGKDSPIVKALAEAADSGKQVTALVELKARFDEENNLIWAKALEDAGAHVIYGIPGLKVHAKVAQVIKKDGGELKSYVHLATGNYNPSTARIYTDLSYFTAKKEYTEDATRFFHFLTGFSKQAKLNSLYMSPTQIKPKLIELIENEIAYKNEGYLVLKANALVDEDIIKTLYKASCAGVKIDLIIRGICCLKPGIKGVSENINVISIIGKYLEHPRIYYFKNASPRVYISSADLMPRNLSRRIELMTPIEEPELSEKIKQILQLQLNDNTLSWELSSEGEYIKKEQPNEVRIDNHEILEEYANRIHKSTKKETESRVKKLAGRLFKES
ncbi:MAG: RNA degradosome polyphosphate kinase [Campylobacterota bacterium]